MCFKLLVHYRSSACGVDIGPLRSSSLLSSGEMSLDRTAFLDFDERTMLYSVTNPPSTAQGQKATSGLLPLLVRANPENMPLQLLKLRWRRGT